MKRLFEARNFQHVLGLAGMLNIITGIIFILYPALFYKLFFREDLVTGPFASTALANILSINLWSFVLITGFGYLWASLQAVKNRLFVFIGGLAKTVAALTWLLAYANGAMKNSMLVGAGIELVFGVLFMLFFLSTRKES
jgi:hypothetical protein